MAVKGKKKRQKRKPVKQMGKITTGLWEQSFLIASLPQFVDARLSEFDTLGGGPQMRIGEWIGISGDMSHIMGMLANAQDIEAMNSMNSAQISSLVPYIKLEKKPTKDALETIPDLSPDPVEISFNAFQSAQDILASRPKYSGILDVKIVQKGKWGKGANHAGSEVELKFTFDSMKTFSENQTAGVSFMDLIPGVDALAKTAGTADTLYQVILTVGWANPYGGTESLFPGYDGAQKLQAISRSIRQYTLQYGGEHDIQITPEGAVELMIKYLPVGIARRSGGMNAELREDILGSAYSLSFSELVDEIEELEEDLEHEKTFLAGLYKKLNKAKQDLYVDKRKALEEALRESKSTEGMTPEQLEAFEYEIKIQADAFASSYQPPTDTTEEDADFFEFDGDEFQDAILDQMFSKGADLKKKLEDFNKNFENEISAQQAEILEKQQAVKDILEKISEKKRHNTSEGVLNDRYSNLVRQMVGDGTMRYLDISAQEQKNAFSSRASTMNSAAEKFREEVLPDLIFKGAKIDYEAMEEMTGPNAEGIAAAMKEIADKGKQELESSIAYPKAMMDSPSQVRGLVATNNYINDENSSKRRIYYFYLGDLLDIVMNNWYAYSESPSAGSGNLKDIQRESLVLGNFYYSKKEGKKEVATAYHMGDFPISFYAFNDWFVSTFVRRGINNISLSFFLSSLADEFFNMHPAIASVKENQVGPLLNSKLPDQPFNMSYEFIATDGQIPRGMDQRALGGLYEPSTEFFEKIFKARKDDSNEPSTTQKYGYHFFGPSVGDTQVPPVPTYTLHLGSEYGFLKSVKYNKKGGGKAARTLRIKEGGPSSKLGMPGAYEVQIEMLGAAFVQPLQIFDLNNNVFGIVGDREALDTTLPRILRILNVEHKISNGQFTTSLDCVPTGQVPRKYVNAAGEVIGDFDRPGVASKTNKSKNKSKKKKSSGGSNPKATWGKAKNKQKGKLDKSKDNKNNSPVTSPNDRSRD